MTRVFKYTEKKLARDIGRVAESIDPTISYEYLPESREVKLNSAEDKYGGPIMIFLGNLYLKVSDLPRKDRIPTIEGFISDALNPPERSPDEEINSLGLRIRTDFEISFRNRHVELMGHEPPPSICVPHGDLLVEVVSDKEESIYLARSDDLAEIGVSEEQAVEIAAARLRRHTGSDQWEQLEDSIWISAYQDDYDFARLVAAGDSASFPFQGSAIVFAPSHAVCLISNTADAEVLTRMVEIGYERSASHRSLSEQLWTMDDDRLWREWMPASSSPSASVAQLQAMRELDKQYADSKELLEQSLGDEDVFVASFQAIQNNSGLSSYSAYTINLPSYLPRSEFVAVVDPELPEEDEIVGRVDWDTFQAIVGDDSMLAVEAMVPAWFRLTQRLSAEQIDRIRQSAEPL